MNGAAIGGGLEIVLACDLAIAVDDACFGFAEPRVGLAAMGGGLHRLVRQIPTKLAMGLILTGRTIDAVEAARLALKYRTPVVMLTDTYLANGSEPWKVPEVTDIPDISVEPIKQGEKYIPYKRDPKTLARRLAVPGRPGFEHRIGGLEKTETGVVSYDAENHEKMCRLRAEKVQRIAHDIPAVSVMGEKQGKVLVIGWGSTRGAITMAVERLHDEDQPVSYVHLRHLNPLPNGLGELMAQFDHVVAPEMNLGQLSLILRAEFLVDVKSISKIQGRMFQISELVTSIKGYL